MRCITTVLIIIKITVSKSRRQLTCKYANNYLRKNKINLQTKVDIDHSIMINVTSRHFDQSAKQLLVGHTTVKYDESELKMSHEGNIFNQGSSRVIVIIFRTNDRASSV